MLLVGNISVFLILIAILGTSASGVFGSQQTLRIVAHYPFPSGNLNLTIRGDNFGLNQWKTAVQMKRASKTTFTVDLDASSASPASLFQFKVLVDDRDWQIGANEFVSLPLNLPVTKVDVYPFFASNKGQYEVVDGFSSTVLGNTRSIVVFTPPSYKENPHKGNYPLLVMHDGQNVFNASTSAFGVSWKAKETIDALVVSGRMLEVVVVGVYNSANRSNEMTYSFDPSEGFGGDGNNYLDFIESEIISYMTQNYRVSQNDWTLLGSSLGGLISCYAGWTRATYKRVGCMSSSFWWNNEDFNTTILAKPVASPKTLFYLDSGDSGPDNDDLVQTETVRDHFLSLGYQMNQNLFFYTMKGGQHNEASWGERFWVPMTSLFAPQLFPKNL